MQSNHRKIGPSTRHDVDPADRDATDERVTILASLFLWTLMGLIFEGGLTKGWLWGLRNSVAAAAFILATMGAFPNSWTVAVERWQTRRLAARDRRRAAIDRRVDGVLLRSDQILTGGFLAGVGMTVAGLLAAIVSHRTGLAIAGLGASLSVLFIVLYFPLYILMVIWSQAKGDRRLGPVRFIGIAECIAFVQADERTKKAVLLLGLLAIVLSAIPK